MTAYWLTGDTRAVMAQLPAGSVDLDRRNVDLARDRIGMWFEETTPELLSKVLDP
jgi:hypothetical protein